MTARVEVVRLRVGVLVFEGREELPRSTVLGEIAPDCCLSKNPEEAFLINPPKPLRGSLVGVPGGDTEVVGFEGFEAVKGTRGELGGEVEEVELVREEEVKLGFESKRDGRETSVGVSSPSCLSDFSDFSDFSELSGVSDCDFCSGLGEGDLSEMRRGLGGGVGREGSAFFFEGRASVSGLLVELSLKGEGLGVVESPPSELASGVFSFSLALEEPAKPFLGTGDDGVSSLPVELGVAPPRRGGQEEPEELSPSSLPAFERAGGHPGLPERGERAERGELNSRGDGVATGEPGGGVNEVSNVDNFGSRGFFSEDSLNDGVVPFLGLSFRGLSFLGLSLFSSLEAESPSFCAESLVGFTPLATSFAVKLIRCFDESLRTIFRSSSSI